jgi:cyclophilin family peptidyl-prolyl cis-trans isomerase
MSVDTGLIDPFACDVMAKSLRGVVVCGAQEVVVTMRRLRIRIAIAVSALVAATSTSTMGVCVDAARVNRDDAFIGYSERSVPARRRDDVDEADDDGGDGLILSTRAGDIAITLRADWAPKLVADIITAVRVGGACRRADGGCAFYRSEAVPEPGAVDNYGGPGPPYALLQGSFEGLGNTHEKEIATRAKRAYACLIGQGADFFIATRDHDEWGLGHTVFGVVDAAGMAVVDAITQNEHNLYPVTRATWGQTNVTTLVERLPFAAWLGSPPL